MTSDRHHQREYADKLASAKTSGNTSSHIMGLRKLGPEDRCEYSIRAPTLDLNRTKSRSLNRKPFYFLSLRCCWGFLVTNYWVLFNYDMVEAPGPADPSSSTPVTFLGVPWESSNPYTINWNASFHDQIIPSPYYAPPWGYHAIAYSFAEKGSWGPNGFTFSGIDYFNYTISIDNYYLAGSQPDPTVFTGPVLTATEHDDLSNYDVTVQWTDWAWALVSINAPAQLFTTSSDGVNFNALTFDQQTAIADGAETTNGLGGSDVVTLNAAHSTFQTGSLSGDTYRVSAGSGNYDITLGAGTDIVNISSNGSSTVTGGTGSAAITISGSGTNTINLGSGATNIRLTGDNNSIDFGAAGETANLYLLTGFQENINGFTSGDVLDIKGFGNLTLAAGIDTSGHASPGQVNLYSNSAFLGTLTFNCKRGVEALENFCTQS
ncbi:hypothetical protein [Bradyrhizobium sp. RT3a]|uniref:hypothetical protein n=1 Tax=Bradyrhizobium sp. RT3a TaxID=3156333 RepID=UPI0033912886